MTTEDGSIVLACVDCNKTYDKMFDLGWSKRFKNTYRFSDEDINKFCFILWKGIYLNKHMDSLERSDETSLPERKVVQQPENEEHHRCWLQTCKESLGWLSSTKSWSISWLICLKWYSDADRCIQLLQK